MPAGKIVRAPRYKRRMVRRRRKTPLYKRLTVGRANSQYVKLRYCDFIDINPGAATPTNFIFRANSLFDPNFSGTGHQPMNFDQWAAMYDHYTVISSKITVRYWPEGTTAPTGSGIMAVYLLDNSTSNTGVLATTQIEQGKCTWRAFGPLDSGRAPPLRKSFNAKRYFSITDIKDNRDQLGAATSTNPTEGAFYHIMVAPFDLSADLSPVNVFVQIDYVAIMTEPRELAQS